MLRVDIDTSTVEAALRRLTDGLEDVDTTPVARRAAVAMRQAAPRRSGRLARAIRSRRLKPGSEIRVAIVYGGVINFGWPRRNIAPSGFIERGLAATLPDAPALVAGELQSLIDTEGL